MRELASRIPLPRHRAADLERYRGRLASFATTSGERFVASCWDESPFGSWCGLLVAEADGCRTLYVESEILADDVRRDRREELAHRRAKQDARGKLGWQPAKIRNRRVSAALQAYAAMTTSADRGAVRDVSQLKH